MGIFKRDIENIQTSMLSTTTVIQPNFVPPSTLYELSQIVPPQNDMVDGCHLEKKSNICCTSTTYWPILMKFYKMTHIGPQLIRAIEMFKKSKIADGCHPENSQYLHYFSTNFDDILRGDAHWSSAT